MSDLSLESSVEDTKKGLKGVAKDGNEAEQYINLKVLDQDGSVVYFKIKRSTPLMKLMNTYCKRNGLSMALVRFRFDGEAILENDSPAKLQMEDGDAIEVFQQQCGGCSIGGQMDQTNITKLKMHTVNMETAYKYCLKYDMVML